MSEEGPSRRTRGQGRWIRLVGLAVALGLGLLALAVGPLWIGVLTPGWLVRDGIVGFLDAMLVAYGVILFVAPPVLGLVIMALRRTREREKRLRLARLLLFTATCLIGLGLLEVGSVATLAWAHRSPDLETKSLPAAAPEVRLPELPAGERTDRSAGAKPLRILVLGESSARGEPYHPWLSVGQILGWQFERIFPGRTIEVDMQAQPGCTLEEMHQTLAGITYRPDLLLLFSGHNEFQTRFSTSRVVTYYGSVTSNERAPGLLERVMRNSSLCTLLLEAREKQLLSRLPDPVIQRHLVDQPAYNLFERAAIEREFGRRLEAIAAYCDRMGTVPLFLIPASNDGGYEPNRSVLPPNTTPEERAQFTRVFESALEVAASDPARGRELLRAIVAAQPQFAEGHFRLAKLLERAGNWSEARTHYEQARECDKFPMRCPEAFRDAYRKVARAHPSVVLVDSPRVLAGKAAHGIVGDHQFHDAQHPAFLSYLALTQDALDQFAARRLLGWPAGRAAPRIDPAECARHYGLGPEQWARVCWRAESFYQLTAHLRYDDRDRSAKVDRFAEAARKLLAGLPPEKTGIPGLGVVPTY